MIRIVILSLFVFCMTGCGKKDDPVSADGTTKKVGPFEVAFPAEPKELIEGDDTQRITNYKTSMNRVNYLLIVTPPKPGGASESAMDTFRDTKSREVSGTISDQKANLRWQGKHPAREYTIQSPTQERWFRCRTVMVDGTIYHFEVNGTEEGVKTPAANAFLDSVKF